MNQIQRHNFIPLTDQQVLKLDGILRADPPALSAAGTFRHIMLEGPLILLINKIQSRGRTIFHAGQTPVTIIINSKIRHNAPPRYENKSKSLGIFINSNIEIRNNLKIRMFKTQNKSGSKVLNIIALVI
jgi:hypothetical protein